MENSKPSTSYQESEKTKKGKRYVDLETCKSCGEKHEDNTLLKHIKHKESCMAGYDEAQLEYIRGWAREREKNYRLKLLSEKQRFIILERTKKIEQ